MACACGEHTRVTSGCFVKSNWYTTDQTGGDVGQARMQSRLCGLVHCGKIQHSFAGNSEFSVYPHNQQESAVRWRVCVEVTKSSSSS